MAGEGARTGTVSAGETDVGNSATIAAFHEILRRMLVGSVHLASLARAWKPRPAHRSHHECGIRPLRSYRRGNSRLRRLLSDGDRDRAASLAAIVSVVLQLEGFAGRHANWLSFSTALLLHVRVATTISGRDRERSPLNRPLAVTFSSLLDCSEADLKVGEMHDRSHYAGCGSLQEIESWSTRK